MKLLLVLGALNGALAVMLGAFGAHGLKSRVDAAMLDVWSTASEYHVYHALALLLCGLLAKVFGIHDLIANLIGIIVGTFINFFLNSLWTWRIKADDL